MDRALVHASCSCQARRKTPEVCGVCYLIESPEKALWPQIVSSTSRISAKVYWIALHEDLSKSYPCGNGQIAPLGFTHYELDRGVQTEVLVSPPKPMATSRNIIQLSSLS